MNNSLLINMKTKFFLVIFLLTFFACQDTKMHSTKKNKSYNKFGQDFFFDISKFDISDNQDINLARFQKEIDILTKLDNDTFPKRKEILFVGSSSIRMWKTLEADMSPLYVISRGFGGATIVEIIHYYDVIIKPYSPSQVVFYCGENDHRWFNSKTIAHYFQYFEKKLHAEFPDTKLFFVSIKPSLSRKEWTKKMCRTNFLIKKYMTTCKNCTYIDVTTLMFNPDQTIDSTLYISDNLHLNASGYDKWTKLIKTFLN